MNELELIAKKVQSKEDFLLFISTLIKDLNENGNSWENNILNNYLEAIQSWVEDMEGYYKNNNLEQPNNISWKVFSDILIAAKMYE